MDVAPRILGLAVLMGTTMVLKVVAVGLRSPVPMPPPMLTGVEPNNGSEVGKTFALKDPAAPNPDNEAATQIVS